MRNYIWNYSKKNVQSCVSRQLNKGENIIKNDLRSFITQLDQMGYLTRIKDKIDWKYEIGERTRQAQLCSADPAALLFENIKDYPGHRLFTNGLGSYALIGTAIGLKPEFTFKDIVKVFGQRISSPVKPLRAGSGPITENILTYNDVDLFKLPVPCWSEKDGGRYIGTWHLNITKDPENGSRNVGVYRMQLLGPRRTSISISDKSHLSYHLEKAERKGVSLPMAVAIGVNETLLMAAAAALPFGVDEFDIAGGLQQRSIELIKCQSVDIEVPADAEIVIEGNIIPDEHVQDGPFFDYAGIPDINSRANVFEVTGLMHRNNPIFRGTAVGNPGAEDHLLYSIFAHLNLVDFHGSRSRQKIQNILLRKKYFKMFKVAGQIGTFLRKKPR